MKSNFKSKYSLVLFLVVLLSNAVSAQKEIDKQLKSIGLNPITTSVPFLLIAPDSRGGAMGDAGVATSPDATSMHWNASKLAFIEKKSVPNLILYGKAGTGKTSLVNIIIKELGADYESYNASEQRGIDVIRDEIMPFVDKVSMLSLIHI